MLPYRGEYKTEGLDAVLCGIPSSFVHRISGCVLDVQSLTVVPWLTCWASNVVCFATTHSVIRPTASSLIYYSRIQHSGRVRETRTTSEICFTIPPACYCSNSLPGKQPSVEIFIERYESLSLEPEISFSAMRKLCVLCVSARR